MQAYFRRLLRESRARSDHGGRPCRAEVVICFGHTPAVRERLEAELGARDAPAKECGRAEARGRGRGYLWK